MALNLSQKQKRIVISIFLIAILAVISVFVTQSIGLGRTGFESENILNQWDFYVNTVGVAFFIVFILYLAEVLFINSGDSQYGNSIGFSSPDEPPAILGKNFLNPFKTFLLFFTLFSLIGFFFFFQNSFYLTGVGVLKQQFTVLDSILFSTFLVPIAENVGVAAILGLVWFSLRLYARKNDMSAGDYKVYAITFSVLTFLVYGLANHWLRYGGFEISLYAVGFFWAVGGLLTALTGSFMPFLALHIVNNLYYDLNRYFSSEAVLLYTIISVIALALIYIFIFKPFSKKKEVTEIV